MRLKEAKVMEFQKKLFRYENISLTYFQKGSGRVILFLQGGGVRALTYKKILDGLSERRCVIAPDLPCFGASTVPKEIWGLREYADFFDEFIKYLNIKEITVIGHSLGGGIALALAKNDKVKNLILIDSAGKSNGYSENKFRYKFYVEKKFFDLTHYKDTRTCLLIGKSFLANRITKFFQWPHIVRIVKKCLFTDFDQFDKINVPTLILWGDKDEIFPLTLGQGMNREILHSTLQLVHGNHDWCLFRYDDALNLITQWLEKREFVPNYALQKTT